MATRILTAICISPSLSIGSAVVTELFFSHERAQKMGWWTLMTTLGTPGGPFIMGFVTQHLGVKWIFAIFSIINFCQFLAYLLLNAETLYIRPDTTDYQNSNLCKASESPKDKAGKINRFFIFRRINPTPFSLSSFYSPFLLARLSVVLIPACAYAIVFCYANIAVIVEMPIVFGEKFHLNSQGTGLQFLAVIIGSVIGEQISGPLSDRFQRRREKWLQTHGSKGKHVKPTHRLWFSYAGFATVIAGLIVWGVRIQQAKEGVWNVTPLIGAAIAAFGNQIITTTLITFAVDCHRERSAEIGVFINFVRQIWGFIGPFYFPYMFEALGFAGSAGVMCGIIAAFGLLPIVGLHFYSSSG